MGTPTSSDTYLKVRDMSRAVRFYEAFLGVESKTRYEDRWASITGHLGFYGPGYDLEHGVPMTEYDREVQVGNNVMLAFGTDGIERERDRVKSLDATGVTDVVEVNLMAPYRLFQFQDPEGHVIEVGKFG